jgi:predicted DNA-binding transcriptional regulator AlpA
MSEQTKATVLKALTMLEARDISNILGIALANAYKLMKRPDFPAIRVSARRYVVPEDAFRKWLDDQTAAKKAGTGADA